MATNGYITEPQFRAAIKNPGSSLAASVVDEAIEWASREVDARCSRRFYKDTNASARYFSAEDWYCCELDDFYTTTGLVIATGDGYTATYGTTWSASDYSLAPVNGLQGGLPWPYTEIRAVGNYIFPLSYRVEGVSVTAKWGWSAVPNAVAQATLLLAIGQYKRPEAPFGIAGFDAFGSVRVREDPAVNQMLAPFMRGGAITVA